MMNWITNLDSFSVPIKLTTGTHKRNYKSHFGALTTIIVYTLSIAYLIKVMIDWQTCKIPPSIQSSQIGIIESEFTLQNDTIQFSFFNQSVNEVEPFQEVGNIITPLLIILNQGTVSEPQAIFTDQQTVQKGKIVSNIINPRNIRLSRSAQNDERFSVGFIIMFVRCNAKFLNKYQSCASEDKIDDFLSKPQHMILLNIRMKSFDPQTRKLNIVQKTQYIALQPTSSLYSQILLQTTSQQINSGIIFNSMEDQQFISNFELNSQSVDLNYSRPLIKVDSMATFLFRLDSVFTQTLITYKNLGEIMAQVGAIAQILFLSQYLVQYVNQKMLENTLITDIVACYYPAYKEIVMNRNIFGKIINCTHFERKLDIPIVVKLNKQLRTQASAKLSLVNIIYEMSRIQLALQSLLGREQMELIHKKHWELEMPYLKDTVETPSDENVVIYQVDYKLHKQSQVTVPRIEQLSTSRYQHNGDIELLSRKI